MKEWRSVREASEMLGLSPRTILRHIASGKIEATRIGTGRTSPYAIRVADIRRLANERQVASREGG